MNNPANDETPSFNEWQKTVVQWQKNIESLRLGTDRLNPKLQAAFTKIVDDLAEKLNALQNAVQQYEQSEKTKHEIEATFKEMTQEMEENFTRAIFMMKQ